MSWTQAQLPVQFVDLTALTSDQYADLLTLVVGTVSDPGFIGQQVGDRAIACAMSHVMELTLSATFGGGVGPISSISGLDTGTSWASPPQTGNNAWWASTNWGQLYLASRQTHRHQIMTVAT